MQSDPQKSQRPYAIIIGIDNVTGLQTARILARHRVPVIGLAKHPDHFCCQTKVCEKILFTDITSEALIRTLENLSQQLNQKAVLIPTTDMTVLLISRHRQKLEEGYHIVLPEPDVVEMLLDKVSFYTYAQEEGLPIPPTFLLRCKEDAQKAAGRLTFPCVLKPTKKTPTWQENVGVKVYKVSNAEEFLSLYDQCSKWSDLLIIQEQIAGSDANHFSCNCYFNAAGKPVVTFVSRKIRQWSPEIGTASSRVEWRDDIVRELTIRLFGNVCFRGFGYLELKRDEHTGEYFIIEPNIGRPTGASTIAEAGGVDLHYAMYCEAVGWPLPTNLEQKYEGVKWIYLSIDFLSALHYWRHGELTFKAWWQSWRGRKTYALFSWTDPGPFLGQLQIGISLLAGYLKTKIRLSN